MDKRLNLTILTKSSLVLRDIDILMKFSNLEVGLTLNSWDEELRGCLEPYATPIKGRIRALEKLHDSGIDTYAFISPVLPGITDVGWIMENIKDIIKYVWIEMINLRLCGKEFKKWFIQENSEACSILHKQVSLFNYISRLRREISRYPIKLKGIIVHPLYEKRSFTIE
jgi:DNA repair photolyase